MIRLTSNVEGDQVHIWADIFPGNKEDVGQTALPVTFVKRRLWQKDTTGPTLVVPVEEARRFAQEILRDTE